MRWFALALLIGGCTLDNNDVDDVTGGMTDDAPEDVAVSGVAFELGSGAQVRISGAEVFTLEDPGRTTITDEEGRYTLAGIAAGETVTLVMHHPDYQKMHTATLEVTSSGLDNVHFQAVPTAFFGLLAQSIGVTVDPEACLLSVLVSKAGASIFDPGLHGEPGALVSAEPEIPSEAGPFYFTEMTLPSTSLMATTEDGGAFWVNVAAGNYTLRAHKEGVEFEERAMTCTPGYLVHATAPRGLQAIAP